MSTPPNALASRLRPLLEKKMFGGIGFMLNGNMAIGTTAKANSSFASIGRNWQKRWRVPVPTRYKWAASDDRLRRCRRRPSR